MLWGSSPSSLLDALSFRGTVSTGLLSSWSNLSRAAFSPLLIASFCFVFDMLRVLLLLWCSLFSLPPLERMYVGCFWAALSVEGRVKQLVRHVYTERHTVLAAPSLACLQYFQAWFQNLVPSTFDSHVSGAPLKTLGFRDSILTSPSGAAPRCAVLPCLCVRSFCARTTSRRLSWT